MNTLTQRMIEQVEWLKAEYAKLIEADPDGTAIEFWQWQRMNTLLGYLEERAAR